MSGQYTTASTGEDDQAGFPVTFTAEDESAARDISTAGSSILAAPRRDDGKRTESCVLIRSQSSVSTSGNSQIGVRVRLRRSDRTQGPKKHKVLRRFQGILIGDEGSEARVILFHKGEHFEYTIPLRSLHAAGIKLPNQPFEMDEVEQVDTDSAMFGYIFKPLAGCHTAFTDVVGLSPDLKAKQLAVIRKFGKSSD